MIETVKEAEDNSGLIVRVYEYENTKTKAALTFGMGKEIVSVTECNLMEEPETEMAHTNDSFEFVIKPFEVKTFKVVLK